jgi:hypothetical protein
MTPQHRYIGHLATGTRLGISKKAVRNLITAGDLPVETDSNGVVRILRVELDRLHPATQGPGSEPVSNKGPNTMDEDLSDAVWSVAGRLRDINDTLERLTNHLIQTARTGGAPPPMPAHRAAGASSPLAARPIPRPPIPQPPTQEYPS